MRLTGSAAMGLGASRPVDQSVAVLRRAVALGVNHVDTAAFYFSEHSAANLIIREALAPYPDDLVVVTKVGPRRAPDGDWLTWARPEDLRAEVERNLAELGLDRLEVVNYRSNGRDDVPAAVAALSALRDEGLLRHVGLSNVDAATLEAAREVTDVACVQNRHAPGYERPDTGDVLAACGEHGIAFVPFFTIAGRARESAAVEPYDAVRVIADSHGATPAQVRIAWTLGARSARARHPRHRRPGPPRAERRRGLPPAHRRRPDGPRHARAERSSTGPPLRSSADGSMLPSVVTGHARP